VPVRPGESINPEVTRERILDTAEELFYLRGISAVGIAEVAEVAEASKMSIYKYFRSKEGLVEATLRQRSERVARWIAEGVAAHPPGTGRVLAVFDLLAGWFAERRFRGCAMVSAAAEDRVADSVSTRLARAHLQTYRDLLVRCLDEAGVADPPPLARQLLLLVEGATIVSAIDGDPSTAADARAAAEALLVSTAAHPQRVKNAGTPRHG
jgi:AcrR family transcriptional regulator